MSKGYGWQCESAILPKSQSKAINNVDNRSLLALKALATGSAPLTAKRKGAATFENQKIKQDTISKKSKSSINAFDRKVDLGNNVSAALVILYFLRFPTIGILAFIRTGRKRKRGESL